MLVAFIASAKPYLAAEDTGSRVGYTKFGQGALTRQPALFVPEGFIINTLDCRTSNGQIRLWVDGDLTTWYAGMSLYIGQTAFALTLPTFSSGISQFSWFGAVDTFEDGKGYAVDVY
jgi:hypothetical protein